MTLKALTLAGAATGLLALPALAHHSFAMFDSAKTLEFSGTVVEFQWTNPHSWIEIVVTDDKGEQKQWGFEMSSPAALARDGWKPKTVVPGDKVTVKAHPMRDGTPGGQFLSIVLPNGQTLE